MNHPKHDYNEYPKTLPKDDFWGQVRRTVNGKPVPEEQIRMIVDAIVAGLGLRPEDNCLDIACGNGYLSSYLFAHCHSLFGVDASPYLIEIAQKNFQNPPRFHFAVNDAAHFVRTEQAPDRFNKVLCYGGFSYFSDADAVETLELLHRRFTSVGRIMIGNLPDRDRAPNFYTTRQEVFAELDNHQSQIGIWRSVAQFETLAASTGWALEVTRMPQSFYAAHYRFDAVLRRKRCKEVRVSLPLAKSGIADLAIFGGSVAFPRPISTSNLVCPDIRRFLDYSRVFYEQHRYTNDGPLVKRLEHRLAEFHQVRHCIAVANGFWALVLSIKALALRERDEVLMPSLTYRRLADAVAWTGLKPRFCEVDVDSLAIDTATVNGMVDARTALILAVHPIVNTCDAPGLCRVAEDRGVPLLFDAVESVYETIGGRRVGTFGDAECFSMHASKLINGFEGGYVTTNDAGLAHRLAVMRGFGFFGHDSVEMLGLNAKLSEVHAAMALAGLDDLEDQVARNRGRYRLYQQLLQDIPGVRLLEFDESEKTSYKNIVVELGDEWPLSRDLTVRVLNKDGALVRAYYSPPLHAKPMAYPHVPAVLPLTDRLAARFMLLPCGHLVDDDDIERFVELLAFIRAHASEIQAKEAGSW